MYAPDTVARLALVRTLRELGLGLGLADSPTVEQVRAWVEPAELSPRPGCPRRRAAPGRRLRGRPARRSPCAPAPGRDRRRAGSRRAGGGARHPRWDADPRISAAGTSCGRRCPRGHECRW
ncbi:hypothetical protein [Streptomyces sp. CS62]|uniref:hypothetical protein n=1 Tax=Streptomyces sp. CS62 TaxID=3119268 RepID=UPI002F938E92